MTTRSDLHALIDELPDSELERARAVLETAMSPAERALAAAPFDDEPETEFEQEALQEARESLSRGEQGMSLEELRSELSSGHPYH